MVKRAKRVRLLKRVAWGFVLGGVLGLLGLYSLTQTKTSGQLLLSGLYGPVSVTRDQMGVVHIDAQLDDHDLYFALGYVHAQDRFWQMELQRRIAQGTLSEILGEAALSKDEFLRTIGFYRAAQQGLQCYDEETRAIIRSYTAGVNAFMAQSKYPLEIRLLRYRPQPWSEEDTVAWSKMVAWDLQNTWQEKINNYMIQHRTPQWASQATAPYPASAPTIISKEEWAAVLGSKSHAMTSDNNTETPSSSTALTQTLQELQQKAESVQQSLGMQPSPSKGSNSWVISGKWTQSGKPFLVNDPHLRLQTPGVWYLAELKGPHKHVIGATIPGSPGVVIGHNDFIAWGVTNVNPDVQDLYIEPQDAPLTTREEIIQVRGQSPHRLVVRESQHGPLISDLTQAGRVAERVAFKWTALDPKDTTLMALLKISDARNWSEFVNVLRYFVAPSQNFIYADRKGNIGYYLPGRFPIRRGWSGALPVPADGKHEWEGYVPFEQLPHVYNPPKGYIVTANNKPVPDNYPYELTFRWFTAPYRAERIIDLIEQKTHHDRASMQWMLKDVQSYLWRDFSPLLLNTPVDDDPRMRQILEELSHWDGVMTADSKCAAVFGVWYGYLREAFNRHLDLPYANRHNPGPLMMLQALKDNSPWCQEKGISDCRDLQRKTLQKTLLTLNERFNSPKDWKWGDVHHAHFSLLGLGEVKALGWLWNRSVSTGGDDFTVNVGPYDMNTFQQTEGAGYRQIVDLSDFNQSQFGIAMGQSGSLWSTHYSDLLMDWVRVRLIPMSTDMTHWGVSRTLWMKPTKSLNMLKKQELFVPVGQHNTTQGH